MPRYTHVFFDLDRTLWDFEANHRKTLLELYHIHDLEQIIHQDFDSFASNYSRINEALWEAYLKGSIPKIKLRDARFVLLLQHFGVDKPSLGVEMADAYLKQTPLQTGLMPGALDILDTLADHCTLSIITNGFPEVQYLKLKQSGLAHFFKHVFISEEVGFSKPDPLFFKHALKCSGAEKRDVLVVGDDVKSDILGARNSGLDCVLYNAYHRLEGVEADYEIDSLLELKKIVL